MKKTVSVLGIDMGSLQIGQPAIIQKADGKFYKTSPVIAWKIHALSHIYRVETTNTIYKKSA